MSREPYSGSDERWRMGGLSVEVANDEDFIKNLLAIMAEERPGSEGSA